MLPRRPGLLTRGALRPGTQEALWLQREACTGETPNCCEAAAACSLYKAEASLPLKAECLSLWQNLLPARDYFITDES